jgi:hypothetical protein
MLHADPVARASLDEVLTHPWMKLVSSCPGETGVLGADVPKYAALRWPDQVKRKTFYRIAALEYRNGDEAWKSLDDALGLLSRLFEAHNEPRGHSPILTNTSNLGKLFRGVKVPRLRSLLAKIRSRAMLDWLPTILPLGPSEDEPRKFPDNLEFKPLRRSQYLRPCRRIRCRCYHTENFGEELPLGSRSIFSAKMEISHGC